MIDKLRFFFKVLVLVVGLVVVPQIKAQCGNHFDSRYLAPGKIGYINNRPFTLNDWNGDGRLDYWNFRPNPSTSMFDVVIYRGLASGFWDWENPLVLTTEIHVGTNGAIFGQSWAGDFDSDGRGDIIFDRLYRNNGNGHLAAQASFALPSLNYFQQIGFYDLTGDGRLDWVNVIGVPNQGHSIGFHTMNADGSYSARTELAVGTTVINTGKAVGDFDGDGKIDLVYQGFSTNGYVFLKNIGGGSFETKPPTLPTIAIGEVRDFDGDGRQDILAKNSGGQTLSVYFGNTNQTFTAVTVPANDADGVIQAVEMNGDGNLDIIDLRVGGYSVFQNNGGRNFTRTDYAKTLSFNDSDFIGQIVLADFSGDGKADAISTAHESFNMFGEEVVWVKVNGCQPKGETKRANFNGDAAADLVTWNPNSGNWRSASPSGTFRQIESPIISFNWGLGTLGDIPALGDFDGDGKTDYSVYRNSEGNWYIFRSSDSSWVVSKFGLPGDIPIPSDYDGGGKTDIAVWRPSDGNWYVWLSETGQFNIVHFGANGDRPVPEDYDGDGQTDRAIYRPSEGNWYYLKSSDGNWTVFNFGLDADKPLPADYDGDGKADLAVFRQGVWYVWRSSNNSITSFNWGIATDWPVPHYRLQYAAEPVVYRASSNFWYNQRFVFFGVGFGQAQWQPVYTGLPNN